MNALLLRLRNALGNKNIVFLIIIVASALTWFLPISPYMGEPAHQALAVLVFVVPCWATNCIPGGLASLLMLAFVLMFMSDSLPPSNLLSYWTSDTVWFILMSFGFAAIMKRTGLGKRLATYIFGMKSLLATDFMMLAIIVLMSLLGLSTNSGKVALVFPMILSMAAISELDVKDPYVRHVAITFCVLCTAGTLILYQGGWVNAAIGELAGFNLNFDSYLRMWTVPAIILCVLKTLLCYVTFKPKKGAKGFNSEAACELRKGMGKLSKSEIKALLCIAVAVALWVSAEQTGFKTGFAAIFVVAVAMLPGIGVITFEEYLRAVPWGMFFMVVGVLCVGSFASTGIVDWLATLILPKAMPDFAPLGLLVVGYIVEILHIPLGTVSAAVSLAIPVFSSLAPELGVSVECVTFVAYMCLVGQAFFPYQSIAYVAGLAYGIFNAKDLLKIGTVLFILMPIFAALACYPWYMLMGWV